MVLKKTKENIAKPKITPAQLILFGLLMAWIVLTNLQQFNDLNIAVQLSIQIAFYIGIMLTAGVKGNLATFIKSIIGIMSNGDMDSVKVMKIENLMVAMGQEVGEMYEKELDRFTKFLKAEKIREELAKLDET